MAGVLKTIGKVAGIIALIPSPIQPIAAAVAAVATIAGTLLTHKPPVLGSVTGITIGANQPSPYIIGETYYGGNRVAQVGYGTEDGVPNSYAWFVDIYSVGGPLEALVGVYTDFTEVTWSGTNANGYYHNNLHVIPQLGATNGPAALSPHWSGTPEWGSSYKLSGLAAIGYNARFPYNGKVYQSGFPQTGAVWRGVKSWDPRADSTYPGGSGASRWADPADTSDFDTARATWSYNRNPGLQALRYALGTWERDESDGGSSYAKVFGVGGTRDQVIVSDFVEHANVCDANGWTVNGVIFEGPGVSKWDNLKRILAAGGAEPVFKGGRLGVKINAPRVTLDTITRDDLAEGAITVPGTQPYTDRKNIMIPKYHGSANKWELVASSPVQVNDYITEDGEEKPEEITYDLVTGGDEAADQAAQLAAYELVNRREQGPITIPLKARMRAYRAGDPLAIDADLATELGIRETVLIVTGRSFDPAAMAWNFTFVTDTADKHIFALGESGTSPPATSIHPISDAEQPVGGMRGVHRLLSQTDLFPIDSDDNSVDISAFDGVIDDGRMISFPADTITGLASGTVYGVFWDMANTAYVVTAAPSPTEMANADLVFIAWYATSTAGVFPTPVTPPEGYGGDGPVVDFPI